MYLRFYCFTCSITVGNSLSDLCVADHCRNQITLKLNVEGNVGKPADLDDTICRNCIQNGLGNGYIYYKAACLVCAAYLCCTRVYRYNSSVYDSRNLLIVCSVINLYFTIKTLHFIALFYLYP